MIIYQSGILTLDYDPATDILFVEWPDMQHVLLPEIRQALKVLVDHIRNYDIKRLLIDSTKANIDLEGEEYKEVLKEFGLNIMTTRLQKLARVLTKDKKREQQVEQVKQEINLTVELRTFTQRTEALAWLKASVAETI
ncbi:STAS/SEC14 domain-containing protein [Rufibacter roseus]|uniref:STAS/SEC14 domain-containing protein n=1 Tax=Rufibacter roseus TaxID=1567108 RepID=A0ABW2DIA9_9BACT|nr:STAS/SEC14 domain-containing protein [Rufibacter roseus]